MHEARERQLGGAAASAERVGALEHGHRPAGLGERDRRGQAVGSGADYEGVGTLAQASLAASPRAFMCASASIVTIGLTPEAVGNAEASIT